MVSAPAQAAKTAAVHAPLAADPQAVFDGAVSEMTAAVHAPSAAEPQAVFDAAAAAAAVGGVVDEICGRVFPE